MSRLPTADLSDDEAEFSLLLAQTMSGLDGDARPMAADALRIGKPWRRRRVAALVAGSLASVTLVGGLGAYGVSTLTSRPGQSAGPAAPVIPSASATPSAQASRTPSVKPPPTATPTRAGQPSNGTRQLPARVAALYLTRLAPAGRNADFDGQQSSDELYVGSTLDRGDGKVGLQINVQAQFLVGDSAKETEGQLRDFYSCGKQGQAPKCEVTGFDDGSTLMTTLEDVVRGDPSQGTAVIADFLRSDGTRVVVQTGNIADIKYGGETRRGVSAREAAKIVTDPVWDLYAEPGAKDVKQARRQITPWKLLPN